MRQLALLGGEPAFAAPLHVGCPNTGDRARFFAYANRMFDNRWLTNFGPLVEEFERELCRFLGVKHCIPVCNATVGLEIAIRALGMQGEVIVPSFTFIAINRRNFMAYQRVLAGIPGLTLVACDPLELSNYQYVIVDVNVSEAGLHRDALLRVLHAENVLARRYFWPGCHRQEPYRTLYPGVGRTLPHTEAVAERILTLPTGTAVGEREIELIGDILRAAVARGVELNALLREEASRTSSIRNLQGKQGVE